MHYEIDYNKLNEPDKEAAALRDIADYLGAEQMAELEKHMRVGKFRPWLFCLICAFNGVQGYPVEVWYKKIYGVDMPEIAE